MLHVKDDFSAGAPISQVPASWFNKVGSFINNLVGGNGIRLQKNENGPSYIELENTDGATSAEIGTPVDKTDTPDIVDESGGAWEWNAGGENGFKIDVYYKIGENQNGYHFFERCRLTVSKDGLIVSAQGLPGRVVVSA